MAEQATDVNTNSAPSTESTAASSQSQQDVIETSSSSNDASTQDVNASSMTMQDFVKQALEQKPVNDIPTEEPKVEGEEAEAKKLDSKTESDKEKPKDEKVDAKEETPTEVKDKVEDGKPVPYDRFQEVIKERNEIREKFEQSTPKIQNYDRITQYCQANNILPDQFEKALLIQGLISRGDGEGALKELLPLVESLQGYVGNKL